MDATFSLPVDIINRYSVYFFNLSTKSFVIHSQLNKEQTMQQVRTMHDIQGAVASVHSTRCWISGSSARSVSGHWLTWWSSSQHSALFHLSTSISLHPPQLILTSFQFPSSPFHSPCLLQLHSNLFDFCTRCLLVALACEWETKCHRSCL